MQKDIPGKARAIIDKHFDRVTQPVQGWLDHWKDVRDVSKKMLDPTQPYSGRAFGADALGLLLGCYDAAFGWLYPTGSQPPNVVSTPNPAPADAVKAPQ